MGGSCKSSEGQSTRDFIRHAGAGAAAGWLFFQLLFNLQLSVFSGFHSNFNLSLIAVSAKVFFFFHFLSILTCHFFSGFHLNYATFHCLLFLSCTHLTYSVFTVKILHFGLCGRSIRFCCMFILCVAMVVEIDLLGTFYYCFSFLLSLSNFLRG